MGDMVRTQRLSTSSTPPPPRQTPPFRTYCSPHHALRRCRGSAPPHPGEIGGAGARLSFREAKRKYSAASPRCRPEPPAAAQGTRARALPHLADPRQRNFSYRVSSHPLCTALQNLTEQLPLSGKALFSRIRSGFQLPRYLPHPDKRRHSALTAPLTMRSAAVAAPLPHTPAKSAGRARVFRFAKRNESTARLRRAAALSRLRRLRARAPAPSPTLPIPANVIFHIG